MLLDVSEPMRHGLRGGVGTVTSRILKHRHQATQQLGIDIVPVVWVGQGYAQCTDNDLPEPAKPNPNKHTTSTTVSPPPTRPSMLDPLRDRLKPVAWRIIAGRWRRRFASIEPTTTDCLILLAPAWMAPCDNLVRSYRAMGIPVVTVIHDLIPLRLPQTCDAATVRAFAHWLTRVVPVTDRHITFSHAVADQLRAYRDRQGLQPVDADMIIADPGAEICQGKAGQEPQAPSSAKLPTHAGPMLLTVGTIEPRKNHLRIIDAFDRCLSQLSNKPGRRDDDGDSRLDGAAANDAPPRLVIVGRAGWRCAPIIDRITSHSLFGSQVLWLNDASDEQLATLYREATRLVAMGIEEGFDLPIIEAWHHGLPVIASDIPVHRELVQRAKTHGLSDPPMTLIDLDSTQALADAMTTPAPRQNPSDQLHWPTWAEATATMFDQLVRSFGP